MAAVFDNGAATPYDVRCRDATEEYWLYLDASLERPVVRHHSSERSDIPHRARHHGRGRGPRRRPVAGPDPAGGGELPDRGTASRARHIRALARIKAAAARVNAELGVLDAEQADAIAAAAAEVVAGAHHDQFPVDVFQTGSGTTSNMNMNEVLASLAARAGVDVHPNDHVNASQSCNDTFPTAIHIAATAATGDQLVPALEHLAASLEAKAAEFADVVKSGRTHLMDATPVTLGQEFGGYAAAMRLGVERLESALPRLAELPLGRHRGRHRHQHPARVRRAR